VVELRITIMVLDGRTTCWGDDQREGEDLFLSEANVDPWNYVRYTEGTWDMKELEREGEEKEMAPAVELNGLFFYTG